MRVVAERTARSLMVSTLGAMALFAPSALAQTAGSASPIPFSNALASAGSLIQAGQLIEARAALQRVAIDEAASTTDRGAAAELLATVNKKIDAADGNEMALQRGELAIREGDLRAAERHASAVANGTAPDALKARAKNILTQVNTRRAAMEPVAAQLIAQVERDFTAGNYAKAKSSLIDLQKSGVALSDRDQQFVDAYALQIVDLEQKSKGRINLSMMQEGTVRVTNQPATAAPTYRCDHCPADGRCAPCQAKLVADAAKATTDGKFLCTKCAATTPCDTCKSAVAEVQPTTGNDPGIRVYNVQWTCPKCGSHELCADCRTAQHADPEMPKLPGSAPDPYFPGEVKDAPNATPILAPVPVVMPVAAPEPMPVVTYQPAPAPVSMPADNLLLMAMQAEAQAQIIAGDKAFSEGRCPEATRMYEKALSMRQYLGTGDIAHAEQKIGECKVKMGSPSGANFETNVIQSTQIARDKATVEFENDLANANAAVAAGNCDKAVEFCNRAKFIVERNKAYFSQSEYDGMILRAENAKRDITAQCDKIKQAEDIKAGAAAAEANKHLQYKLAKEREEKIKSGLARIRQLQREQKYSEALDVCNTVLFLDPQNPAATLSREILVDLVAYKRRDDLVRRKQMGLVEQRLQGFDASIPPKEIIEYSDSWPVISALRTGVGGYMESEENRRTHAALTKDIPARFENTTFRQAVAYIGATAGVRTDVDWKSLEAVGVEPGTKITLDLGETKASVVLDRLLTQVSADGHNKAAYAVRDGIVGIGSADAVKKQTITVTYPITDLLHVAPDYTDIPDMSLDHQIGKLAERRMAVDPFRGDRGRPVPERRERVRQLVATIEQSVDPDSWKENGGDIGSVSELGGVLVITNTPQNHQAITGLLSKLRDIRQTQINIEARFLLVDQNFFERINFDVDVTLNPNATNPVTPPNNWTPITVNNNANLPSILIPQNNSFVSGLLSAAPALGIAGTYLDDIQVNFIIQATQADNRTVTLTAPRLTFTNGQIANVSVGTQRAYVSDLTPITGDGVIGFDPVPATLTEGVSLLVEAVASADRKYVTMNIETGISQLKELVPFTETAVAAGGGGGGVGPGGVIIPPPPPATATGTFQLPIINVSRVNTTVTAPDQGTILLGGQRITTEVEIETGVPVLSKLPIINRFFTNRIQSRQDQSLLMLVKPTVLVQSENEERAFPGLSDSLRGGN